VEEGIEKTESRENRIRARGKRVNREKEYGINGTTREDMKLS